MFVFFLCKKDLNRFNNIRFEKSLAPFLRNKLCIQTLYASMYFAAIVDKTHVLEYHNGKHSSRDMHRC